MNYHRVMLQITITHGMDCRPGIMYGSIGGLQSIGHESRYTKTQLGNRPLQKSQENQVGAQESSVCKQQHMVTHVMHQHQPPLLT